MSVAKKRQSNCAILLLLVASLFSFFSHATTELRISLLLFNGPQRTAYHEMLTRFSVENPSIKLTIYDYESEHYKSHVENWLSADHHSDVMYWFSGQRLGEFVEEGWVDNLDELWELSQWRSTFTPAARASVSFNDHKYGMPIHYYPWAIYFKKSLFKRLQLPPPQSWDDFLQVCEILKNNGITPIVLGSRHKWMLSVWFDYLNLRLNGLAFYQALASGKVSYKHPKVVKIFRYWQLLIDKGYFLAGHEHLSWQETVPYIYREMGGMILLGNFWTSQIPLSLYNDIDMVRFPVIDKRIPVYVQTPTDVFIVPSNSQNKKDAYTLLQYMARADVQARLNSAFGMLAPNRRQVAASDHLLNKSYQITTESAGFSQFYDRDYPSPISTQGLEQFARFVADPDNLNDVLDKLEVLRLAALN